jgi:hypothetical protein
MFYIKYLFIYYNYKLKLVKEQLARDETHLDNSSPPFSPILLSLKIRLEKIQKPNNYLKTNFNQKENIKIFYRKFNKLFSFGVDI